MIWSVSFVTSLTASVIPLRNLLIPTAIPANEIPLRTSNTLEKLILLMSSTNPLARVFIAFAIPVPIVFTPSHNAWSTCKNLEFSSALPIAISTPLRIPSAASPTSDILACTLSRTE